MANKKEKKNKAPSVRYKKYKVNGDTLEKQKNCPRCGPGTFLAMHKDREYCGQCHYTEFKGAAPKQEAKSE